MNGSDTKMRIQRIAVIYNPLAGGGGKYSILEKWIRAMTKEQYQVECIVTSHKDHAVKIAREIRRSPEIDLVVGAGGDGTMHEIVWGLFSEKMDHPMPLIASFPIGSGNDWAKHYHFDLIIENWLNNLEKGIKRTMPYAKVHIKCGRNEIRTVGINSLGIGISANVVENLSKSRRKRFHKAGYLKLAFVALFSYRYQSFGLCYHEVETEVKPLTINVGLTKFSGGGLRLFPQFQKESNLALTVIKKCNFPTALLLALKLLVGDISKMNQKVICKNVDQVEVKSLSGKKPLEIDGECYYFEDLKIIMGSQKVAILQAMDFS